MGLSESYELCRRLHRRHGRTYYLATRLLPAWKRRHVHALYGFARYADEIVDAMDGAPARDRAARLRAWGDRFLAGLAGVRVDDPILPAVLHTLEVFQLDRADFAAFLRSMAMDLTVAAYPTYGDLLEYMEGSAAVIGTMMLPILGSTEPAAAREPARQLGFAFQLTNFIRDVAEDLDRGRIYLPLADLARFGLHPADLRVAGRAGGGPVHDLIAFEVARAREHYRRAAPGIPLLAPGSQPCIRAAYQLYGGILDEIEAGGYDVFSRRAAVPNRRRFAVAAGSLLARPGSPVRAP
ncbi:MAG: phytoene/squalene synthase family protein [Actinobacteria bacterium]|nr:MAG: phytoene/squalene synthase family protein [Actinomycetota bacterium]